MYNNNNNNNNDNVHIYVLILQTGAHNPLQSKEPKHSQNNIALARAYARSRARARTHTHTHTPTHPPTPPHTHTHTHTHTQPHTDIHACTVNSTTWRGKFKGWFWKMRVWWSNFSSEDPKTNFFKRTLTYFVTDFSDLYFCKGDC